MPSADEFFADLEKKDNRPSADAFFADLTPGATSGRKFVNPSEAMTIAKAYTGEFSKPIKNFGKGFLKGATLQDLTPEEKQATGTQIGEFAGSMVPMAAASMVVPASPIIGGMARAGLAGMTYGAMKGAVNQTPLKKQISDIPEAGLGFMGGEVVGRGAGKLFSPFSGGVKPELEAARKTFESVGGQAPLGNMTSNRFVQAMERGLEYTPFGQAITNVRQKALGTLKNYAETIGKKIGATRPPEVQGNIAKESLAGLLDKFHGATEEAFNTVMPIIRQANPEVDTKLTLTKIEDIIKNRSGELEPAVLDTLRKLYENIRAKPHAVDPLLGRAIAPPEKGSIKVFDSLKTFRTNLGNRLKFNDPAFGGVMEEMKGLYGAVSEDMSNTVKKVSENAYNDLQSAGDIYKNASQIVKSEIFKHIASSKPENVHKFIIMPNSPSQVEMGKEILGENFRDVARQWWDDLLRRSSPEGFVNPQLLKKKLFGYGSTLDAIARYIPGAEEEFGKLKQITDMLTTGKDVTQGSQTAYIQKALNPFYQSLVLVGMAFGGQPQAALRGLAAIGAGLGAEKLGTMGITSGPGREFLTRGYPKIGNAARKIVTPIVQRGLQMQGDQ